MPRTKAPETDGSPLGPPDAEMAQSALEQLARPLRIVEWCERVGIPCEAARKDVDDLLRFLQACGAKVPEGGLPRCSGCPLDHDDLRRVEQELQQLSVPMSTIQWCKKSGIPAEAAGRECDELAGFFGAVLKHSKGQQGPVTGLPG